MIKALLASVFFLVPGLVSKEESGLEDLLKTLDEIKAKSESGAPSKPKDPKEVVEITFEDDISEGSGKDFRAALVSARGASKIIVTIDTHGGDMDEAFKIAKEIERTNKYTPVECIVDGNAFSSGFIMLESCGVRKMTARSALMAHEPYMLTLARADRGHLISTLREIDVMAEQYAATCSAKMKVDTKEFLKRIHGKDWWFNPREALEFGAVDQIIPTPNKVCTKDSCAAPPVAKPSSAPAAAPAPKK